MITAFAFQSSFPAALHCSALLSTGKMAGATKLVVVCSLLVLLLSGSLSLVNAQSIGAPLSSPTPAPAPAPAYVNLADLLSVAGPFQTFLKYLESTKVIDTFQKQANDTDEGITIFVPKDKAFSSLKKASLSNLTQDQLKSFLLFHALPHYYSLSDFKNLSQSSPVTTFGGGQYMLNFSDVSGTVHMSSGWTDTTVSSSVHSTDPVAIYQIDEVLLPQAIFGTPPPPAPAPAPTPENGVTADSPRGAGLSPGSAPDDSSSSNHVIISWGYMVSSLLVGLIVKGLF